MLRTRLNPAVNGAFEGFNPFFTWSNIQEPTQITCSFSMAGADAAKFTAPAPIVIPIVRSRQMSVSYNGAVVSNRANYVTIPPSTGSVFTVTIPEPVASGLTLEVLVQDSIGTLVASLSFANATTSVDLTYSVVTRYGSVVYWDTLNFYLQGNAATLRQFEAVNPIQIRTGTLIEWEEPTEYPASAYQGQRMSGFQIAPASPAPHSFSLGLQCSGMQSAAVVFPHGSTIPLPAQGLEGYWTFDSQERAFCQWSVETRRNARTSAVIRAPVSPRSCVLPVLSVGLPPMSPTWSAWRRCHVTSSRSRHEGRSLVRARTHD